MEIKSYQARIDSLKNSLEEGIQELSADTGSLIYSQDLSSDQYLLLLSGSVRLIDHNLTFGSLTAGILNSPQILGIENFLSITSSTEIRCTTKCRYILLDPKSLNKSQNKQIQELLTSRINATEAISIFSLISNNFPLKASQLGSLNDVLQSTQLLHNNRGLDSHDAILFLDKECDGFIYGQVITPEICSSFFTHENWPRVAGIEFRKEVGVSKNSNDHQTISTTEPKQQLKSSNVSKTEESS